MPNMRTSCPMAEPWDTLETFFGLEVRNRNVHEWNRQRCRWT